MEQTSVTEVVYHTSDLEALIGLSNYYGWILREIRPFLGLHMAEIGAGIGTFTDVIAREYLQDNQKARLEVFEPARNLHEQLRNTLHRNHSHLLQHERLIVLNDYFNTSKNRFDTVIMINVLEHIPQDGQIIRAVHESLGTGGTLIVFAPALQWLFSPFDESVGHQRRYSKESLKELFLQAGFALPKAKYMDCLGLCPWYLRFVWGGSLSINPRLARLYDRWGVPVTQWLEDRWEPRIGKNVLMVGRKTRPS